MLSVFQFRICQDYYGPHPVFYSTVFVVADNVGYATRHLFKVFPEIHSYEVISSNPVILADTN